MIQEGQAEPQQVASGMAERWPGGLQSHLNSVNPNSSLKQIGAWSELRARGKLLAQAQRDALGEGCRAGFSLNGLAGCLECRCQQSQIVIKELKIICDAVVASH